jgi:hypothetical protein
VDYRHTGVVERNSKKIAFLYAEGRIHIECAFYMLNRPDPGELRHVAQLPSMLIVSAYESGSKLIIGLHGATTSSEPNMHTGLA